MTVLLKQYSARFPKFRKSPDLRVVFPLLRGPGKPPGRQPPKNGEKLQNSPPRSDPRKWGKITKKLQKCIFGVILPLFWGNFPQFRGSERGGEFCNFSPFFGDFRPSGFPGPLRGKTTRKPRCSQQNHLPGKVRVSTHWPPPPLRKYLCRPFK